MKRRILIADEADLMLVGIQTILKDNPACEVVSTVRSASELLETCKQIRPEVILLNEQLDTLVDVLALVEWLKHITPQSRLMILGGVSEGLLIRDLFACGVLAYLFEGDDLTDHLLPAVSAVVQNRPYLPPTANSAYLLAMQSLLHNFLPYCPRARLRSGSPFTSPFHKLNGMTYRTNWLENLLVASSRQVGYFHQFR